jgi:hypothetical protein
LQISKIRDLIKNVRAETPTTSKSPSKEMYVFFPVAERKYYNFLIFSDFLYFIKAVT